MKILVSYTLLALILVSPVQAQDDLEKMLKTARTILSQTGTNGDDSAARRLLVAILEKDPNHPGALWEVAFIEYLNSVSNTSDLHHRAIRLAAAGKDVNTIVDNAKHRNQPAFAHYVLARYAAFYKAYDRALEEIEQAVKLNPKSIRYLYFHGSILASKGNWEKQDKEILKGIDIIGLAQQRNHPDSDISFLDADFYFQQAWFNSLLTTPKYEKTIEFYQAVIQQNQGDKTDLAFSWNNSSIAYRKLGQCQKAKHAAEKALEVMKFGAARSNLQYAKFCLEMGSLTDDFKQEKI